MTFEEFVLTYRDENDKIVINVADYYDNFVKPLDTRFKGHTLTRPGDMVLCCFKDHNDINPSLGTMMDKKHKGVILYHCFGCGAVGSVIRMHQRIQKDYFNRVISVKDACIELCELFKVDYSDYFNTDMSSDNAEFYRREKKCLALATAYTIRDYEKDLAEARGIKNESVKIKAINKANIKYIATSKKLY